MKKALSRGLAVSGLLAAVGVMAPQAAHAACGQMDFEREPATYAFLHWGTTKSGTRIEPHGFTGRAVVARYVSGSVRYWYGPLVFNPASSGTKSSSVYASVGTYVGNYYSDGKRNAALYRDYPVRSGWTYGC